MSSKGECKSCGNGAYVAAVLGAFLIVAALVGIMRYYTKVEPLGASRADERSKALKELRASNEEVLYSGSYAWQDQAKGVVRMPITNAMELSLKLWQNPAAGRANLTNRVEKATAKPPPVQLE